MEKLYVFGTGNANATHYYNTCFALRDGDQYFMVDAGGGSDGNHIAESGVPVVDGCGPAGSGLHTEREYLQLDTVEERIRMQANVYSLI